MSEEAKERTFEERIEDLPYLQYQIFYRSTLNRLGISRHSEPSHQIKGFLTCDRSILLAALQQAEGGTE